MKKVLLALMLIILTAPMARAFVTAEPFEPWQATQFGYRPPNRFYDAGPANFGARFRVNIGTVYYAYDTSFLNFFGVNGQIEADKAFTTYNVLTNYSKIDPNSYPEEVTRVNSIARALNLVDVKSTVMSRIVNVLGLLPPADYVWNLYDRFIPTGSTLTCETGGEQYLIVQRNFDPITGVYSSYLNDVLYDYQIIETCTGTPIVAFTIPVPTDPILATTRATVAEGLDYGGGFLSLGRFFTGFTRDDVGGLKTLLTQDQFQVENVPTDSVQISTNGGSQILNTLDLAAFLNFARTNPPSVLLTTYPDLNIISTNTYFTNTIVTNFGLYLTNFPFGPAGAFLVTSTNFTTVPQTNYSYVFGNLQIVHAGSTQTTTTITDALVNPPFAPAGYYTEQFLTSSSTQAGTNGDFYIIPRSLCGAFQIVSTQAVQVISNVTSTIVVTNNVNFSGSSTIPLVVSQVTFFTNYFYVANAVQCFTNVSSVRAGIDKVTFIRRDYDSILSNFWTPVTNTFRIQEIVNNAVVTNTYVRTITRPDMVLSTTNRVQGPSTDVALVDIFSTYNFDTSHVSGAGFGPGVIDAHNINMFFGISGGLVYFNSGFNLNGTSDGSIVSFQWGSFDGTTNQPTVYPTSNSISNLAANLRFQITNTFLTPYSLSSHYTTNNPYRSPIGVSGGVAPYMYSISTNSPGSLPPGLVLTNISGQEYISGVGPTNADIGTTYDFYLQVKDSSGLTAFKSFFLLVNP